MFRFFFHYKLTRVVFIFVLVAFVAQCYSPPPVKSIRNANAVEPRTLFIALDGVDYALIKELYDEGHFREFLPPVPFGSTFPSDTTLGFTGILQPLNVGRVPGYEVRFYSFKNNKIMGGTPFDIYKIPIKYKYYFDSFRHQMHEKAIMYMFPGMAGKQDLVNAEKALFSTDKKILMTYLGGTDGFSHILGRNRTKKFLIYMDSFLQRLQKRYRERKGEDLRIVLFSDHGFHHHRMKTVRHSDLQAKFKEHGFSLNDKIESDRDVVTVPFGLLSAGVLFTPATHRSEMAKLVSEVKGVDVVLWHLDKKDKIYILNSKGESAFFEYQSKSMYRYVPQNGDPLGYTALLKKRGYQTGQWLSDAVWKKIAYNHKYPDVGYRIYDAFFDLVKNPASIMFSVKENYQFGSLLARIGTYARLGHKGTHGGLFKATTWGVAMTNENFGKPMPEFLRYNELFDYFLPQVTKAYPKHKPKKEVTVIVTPELHEHVTH